MGREVHHLPVLQGRPELKYVRLALLMPDNPLMRRRSIRHDIRGLYLRTQSALLCTHCMLVRCACQP